MKIISLTWLLYLLSPYVEKIGKLLLIYKEYLYLMTFFQKTSSTGFGDSPRGLETIPQGSEIFHGVHGFLAFPPYPDTKLPRDKGWRRLIYL